MYTNSQMSALIDEHVHVKWQREALKMKLCDGLTHEQIAEITGYSTQYIKEIIKKNKALLFTYI